MKAWIDRMLAPNQRTFWWIFYLSLSVSILFVAATNGQAIRRLYASMAWHKVEAQVQSLNMLCKVVLTKKRSTKTVFVDTCDSARAFAAAKNDPAYAVGETAYLTINYWLDGQLASNKFERILGRRNLVAGENLAIYVNPKHPDRFALELTARDGENFQQTLVIATTMFLFMVGLAFALQYGFNINQKYKGKEAKSKRLRWGAIMLAALVAINLGMRVLGITGEASSQLFASICYGLETNGIDKGLDPKGRARMVQHLEACPEFHRTGEAPDWWTASLRASRAE